MPHTHNPDKARADIPLLGNEVEEAWNIAGYQPEIFVRLPSNVPMPDEIGAAVMMDGRAYSSARPRASASNPSASRWGALHSRRASRAWDRSRRPLRTRCRRPPRKSPSCAARQIANKRSIPIPSITLFSFYTETVVHSSNQSVETSTSGNCCSVL